MRILVIVFFSTFILSAQKNITDATGLKVGEEAPLFSAIGADSSVYSLQTILKDGPVVLIFYRGFWCPYCNRHLGNFQDSLTFIQDLGANVIAVSPEKPEYLQKMADKSGARFTLLYDDEYKISNAYNVSFLPDKRTVLKYNTFLNANFKESHSNGSDMLPIPATFIISEKGIIIWRQFDPDYKKRSSVRDIINVLSE